MVLLIVILAALAFIFVLIFAAKALKGEKSRPPAAASVPTTKQKPLQRVSTTAASSQSSSASSVLHKEIRQYLINGVSLIFDEKAPANDMSLIPRTLEQIDPQVLETVSEHLARMDQFRIRQARLEKYLNDPAVQMADLSKGITSDPLMTAKILNKDALRVDVLRFYLNQVKNKEIEFKSQNKEITDEDAFKVLRKEIKNRKESIELYEKLGRTELLEREKAELGVYMEFAELFPFELENNNNPTFRGGK